MIRRPPRSTRVRSSAASDVYKRQYSCRALQQCTHAWPIGYAPECSHGSLHLYLRGAATERRQAQCLGGDLFAAERVTRVALGLVHTAVQRATVSGVHLSL